MPARRRETRGIAVASWLLSSVAAGQLVAVLFAGPASGQPYHRETGQEHYGRRCSYQDTQVAGGTIVGVGGQVIAGGGGTGVGCDTFYAYEVRAGEPQAVVPWTEPGIYLNPGGR